MIASHRTWDTEPDVYSGRRPQPQYRLGQRGQFRIGEDGRVDFLPALLTTAMPLLNKILGGKPRRPVYIPPPKPAVPTYVWAIGGAGLFVMMGLVGYLVLKK